LAQRRVIRARVARRLPRRPQPVDFADSSQPLVSIVVPVYNRWAYTNACLKALAAAHASIACEIVVVDDGSTDRTSELLAICRGIRVVRLERNAGFAAACNAGVAEARGRYVHFLNNDAFVTSGWLEPLISTFAREDRIAAVVSQLRDVSGRLSEAGGIIWSDGRGWNYGRGQSPRDWRYASLRDVDYGSAASLMVDAAAFRRAGGFSEAFAPAYYEDVDLCFRLRSAGDRIVYQPHSIVYHVEGVSYGSNLRAEARAIQARNRERFVQTWSDRLQDHSAPDPANADAAARRLCGSRAIVVADERVPFTDRDAGSRRTFFLLRLLRERGWHVIFASLDNDEYQPYTDALRQEGIDVIPGFGARGVGALQRQRLPVAAVWLSRPETARRLSAAFRRAFSAPIVFDAVDLHYRRLQREAGVRGRQTRWRAMERRELALARFADVAVTGGRSECEVMRAAGVARVFDLPVIEPLPRQVRNDWESRHGIVFLGNYAHAPNVDAARWLCEAIMPLVWGRLPSVTLTLAGADPTRTVRALASPLVNVPGYVSDVAALLAGARVFAAPLRFGAGTKGKVVYALAHGIPVVTTPVGAEDVFAESEYDRTPESPESLAQRIVELHERRGPWEELSARGRTIAERFTPAAAGERIDAVFAAAGLA